MASGLNYEQVIEDQYMDGCGITTSKKKLHSSYSEVLNECHKVL